MLPNHLRLDVGAGDAISYPKPMQFKLKHLLILVTFVACGLAFLRSAYIGLTHIETAEDVDQVKWLSKSAAHVSPQTLLVTK